MSVSVLRKRKGKRKEREERDRYDEGKSSRESVVLIYLREREIHRSIRNVVYVYSAVDTSVVRGMF